MKVSVLDLGELFTVENFAEYCEKGYFMDQDGSGFYSDGTTYDRDLPALPSDFVQGKINLDFEYVMWFNK